MADSDPSMRRRLVIGQVCHGSLGGSSRVACRLANALARRRHRVHVFSREILPWAMGPDVHQHACPNMTPCDPGSLCLDWPEGDRTAFAHMLTVWLTRERFDVLHFHYVHPFAGIVRQVAESLGDRAPVLVGTLHGTDLTQCLDNTAELALLSRDLAAIDELTTVSEHMQTLSMRLMRQNRAVRVMPNFIEDTWPQPVRRSTQLAPTRQKPGFLHVSNFRAVKDVELLARLFLQIYQQTDAELWLVGDGPGLPALRRSFDRSPAKAAVRYHGAIADPAPYFEQATALLSTSRQESFGLAVLEAMASGTVAVATAVGGVPELVEDDVTGILFHPIDLDVTVARILSLLDTPAELEAMRARAFQRTERLREAQVIGLYEDLYLRTARSPADQLGAIA